jgi:HK97 family phage prohead protease
MERIRSIRSQPTIRDNRRLGWYAAIFDTPTMVYDFRPGEKTRSHYTEVVRPGAFLEALKGQSEVVANIDHDDRRTFARRSTGELLLQEDKVGLYCSTWLPENTLGDAIKADVEKGRLDASSFKFSQEKDRWNGDECELLSFNLHDVCLTDRPAYESTRGEVHLRTFDRCMELFARLKLVKFKLKRINN